MLDPVLIYDASNRLFRRVGERLAARSERLKVVPWDSDGVEAFLEAQFGGCPFAFMIVDLGTGSVHAGSETVYRLLKEQGVPRPVANVARRAYPAVADPLGRLLHGRRPAAIDGTFPVEPEARPHIADLRRSCTDPGCAG